MNPNVRSVVGRLPRKPLLLPFLLCWLGYTELGAQPGAVPTEEFSVVMSANKESAKKAVKGAKIFYDRKYLFGDMPSWLKGMDFMETSMGSSNAIVPVTEGYLYVITPLSGQNGSQEKSLVAQGFVNTGYPSFKLFRGQKQKIGVFKKAVLHEKFRLGHIQYEGWGVPFFRKRELPSVSVAARLSWMPGAEYAKSSRRWQGCPSIEITGKRRWASWFSGGAREPDAGNYGIVAYSDDGKVWIDPALVICHPDSNVRVVDTELWEDPGGRLWIFWTQNTGQKGFDGIWGTWAVYSQDPEAVNPHWSVPRRHCDGLTRNKPIVLSGGEWLLPSYNWINHQSALYISGDGGNTWFLQGGPVNEPIDNFYEHMAVELVNGNIWMLQRSIRSAISADKGITWSSLDTLSGMPSANSRLYIGRLRSGRLLLIYNKDANNKRKNLSVFLSEDDGHTWPYQLLLDERDEVSYPEAIQDVDGRIFVCYDRSRTGEKEILVAIFSEEDIIKGKFISELSETRKIISKVAN